MTGSKALVAAGHPLVVQTALDLLDRGGNAFDAAIGGGFAATVAEPLLTSLGGGGFLLARTVTGAEILFDFFVDTPGRGLPQLSLEPHFFPFTVNFAGSDQDFNIGLGSVAVPGVLKGFLYVQERLGRLPLREVLAPAVRLAREGLVINHFQAYTFGLLHPMVTMSEEGRALFTEGGQRLTVGKRHANPLLAEFLIKLPEDRGQCFYSGEIAARVAADMRQGQGLLTAEDLAAYRVIERPPLAAFYRGLRLLTNPPPSFGGTLLAAMLRLLEEIPLGTENWGSALHLLGLAGVMAEVENKRSGSGGFDEEWRRQAGAELRRFTRGTTHISVVDREGNVAAMSTSNGEGSGYLAPGTGIMLNNMMGEDDLHPEGFHASPPGRRVASMMSPALLLADDAVILALGSGGSKRIRSAILQVVSNIIDFKMKAEEAVQAPRLHWDGSTVQMEPGFPKAAVALLRQRLPVNVWKEKEIYFGGVHAVVPGSQAVGDQRRGGWSGMTG